MAVLPTLRRKGKPSVEPAAEEAASIQAARARARRRLIGAAVLVGIGIIGFPLLFETQPRPIAVDIPIEIPARDKVAAPALPASPVAAAASQQDWPVITERAEKSASTAAAAASSAQGAGQPAVQSKSASAVATAKAEARPAKPPTQRSEEARRAQALLDGKPVADAAAPADANAQAPRYVVQAGAYSDAGSLHTARQKVEKLGLKTYVQTVDTDAGKRTRLRVGPFASRDEADQAAARIKSSGLAVNVLTL